MNRTRPFAITLVLVSLAVTVRASAVAERPTSTIRKTNQTLHSLLKQVGKAKGTSEEKVQARLQRTVNSFLDFQELARRSLGKHWDQRTPAEREEFVAILRDLIERNYVKQLRDNLDYQLEYRDERVEGDKAQVKTVVKVQRNGRTEEVSIDYEMHRTSRGWLVFDVITDDVSIVRNYRSQFNRIIRRDSFEVLVDKMKTRLQRI